MPPDLVAVHTRSPDEQVTLAPGLALLPAPEGACVLCGEALTEVTKDARGNITGHRQVGGEPWALYAREGSRTNLCGFAHGVCVEGAAAAGAAGREEAE